MKNIMIFGDSYSTFKGFIPEENEPYYYPGGFSNGVEKNDEAMFFGAVTNVTSGGSVQVTLLDKDGNIKEELSFKGTALLYTKE